MMDSHSYIRAKIYIEALKDSVCKGIPVVVLTRSVVGSRGLHYITVVGFDNDYIYTADSVKDHKNSDDSRYNRKISISDFKKYGKPA